MALACEITPLSAFLSTNLNNKIETFDRLGERVGVMFVPKKGQSLSRPELLNFVQGKLANFKIPKPEDMFFQNEILPRGATGKILKRAIREEINTRLEKSKQSRI